MAKYHKDTPGLSEERAKAIESKHRAVITSLLDYIANFIANYIDEIGQLHPSASEAEIARAFYMLHKGNAALAHFTEAEI